MLFATANGKQTPAKVRVPGLLTLSSSHKKKNLSKCFQKTDKNASILIDLDYGLVKRESFIKFAINVFQYLLYDNDVIPIPFQYFDRICVSQSTVSESATNASQTKRMNLLSEMFASLHEVFSFLRQLFEESTIEPSHIAMCIGDSISFAKEIFSLNLSSLNLCSKSIDKFNAATTPLLTLNYLVKTFYKKLLNEASEEMMTSRKGNFAPKGKSTNVFFTVKISSQDLDKFELFANSKRTDKKFTVNRFHYLYRLGCTITKTTSFSLNHQSKNNVVFEIFNESSFNVEEIIEEKLIEEDEENLTNTTLATLNESSESVGSNNVDLHEATKDDELVDEKKPSESEFIWVQISSPIRCFSKM